MLAWYDGVAELLVVGVARVAGVDEQHAPALGRLDCFLHHLPGHYRGAAEAVADPLRVGGQEAVARPVIKAVPGDEQHHRVGLLGLLQQVDGIQDVAGGRQLRPVGAVDQHALDHLGVRRPEPALGGLHPLAGIRTRVAQVAGAVADAPAGLAELGILVDADRQDVERAALVERALAVQVERDRLGLVADVVAERDADVVAALAERHVERAQAGAECRRCPSLA